MADDFSPFLNDATPEDSMARLAAAEPVGLTPLPTPVPKKLRAILHLPKRKVSTWKWFLPPAIGAALMAGGVAIALPAYEDRTTGDAVTLTVLASLLVAIGVLIIVGGARAQIAATRGTRAALLAATQPDGTVKLRATLMMAKADFPAGATIMVSAIEARAVTAPRRPPVQVTLEESASGTTLDFLYFGAYDEATHDQLRDGLRLYGLRAPQTFADLPRPTGPEKPLVDV